MVGGGGRLWFVNGSSSDFDDGYGYVYQTNDGLYGSFGCRLIDRCAPKCRALTDGRVDGELHHAAVLGPNLDGKCFGF